MPAGRDDAPPGEPARRPADTGRLAAFSDGVFAIVITLLVLDLRVPEYHEGGLLVSLGREAPSYLAFVVSFVYIGVLWLNHHALLRLVRGTTLALSWINIALLFGVVIIPFPTAVLASALVDGDAGDLRVAVVMYALAAALMSAPWLVFFGYLRRHPELRADGVDQDHVRAQEARPITGLVLYGLTGLVALVVNPLVGLLGIIVMIVFHGVTSEGLSRRRRRAPARS
ncbi:TMEM175 family protein [Micromonospora sp. NPDC004551]|uniref:TMEM175 family protein n=1 Tax=Micromonospora sp. NPDC004551 TaxID=3154284 RepID=UPI0033B41AE3